MKQKFFTTKVSILVVTAVAVFTVAGIVWAGQLDNIHRWAWNAIVDTSSNPNPTGFGWLSTNCRNDFDNDGVIDDRCKSADGTKDISYGLKVNVDNSNNTALGSFDGANDLIQGCAWSATFGWVCFDKDPVYCPVTNTACNLLNKDGVKIQKDPNYPFYYLKSSKMNNIDTVTDARAVALNLVGTGTEAQGYIGFPFDGAIGADGKTGKTPAALGLSGNVTSCMGCTSALGGGNDKCDVCYLVNDGFSDPAIAPNPNIMCTQCTSCNATVRGGSCGNSANTCAVTSCAKCYTQPGVIVNYYPRCQNNGAFCTVDTNCGAGPGQCTYKNAPAELCGWAFNSAKQPADAKAKGLGWIAFSPAVYGQATPYVSVKDGSVLSGGDITQPLPPPQGRANATYLIDAKGSVTRWTSSTSPAYVRQNLGNTVPDFLTYDDTSGQAISTIGSIDINGIITRVNGGLNKYGSLVEDINVSDVPDELAVIGGRVFNINSPLVIDSPVVVGVGSGGISGSGIIYVNGNLTINKNITYATTAVNRLKYIPSIVWIVKGDVTIDPSVDIVAGTFIILGDGTPPECPAIVSTTNPPPSASCGRFSTGNDKTLASPRSLTVYGHVLAKQFLFQRSYNAPDGQRRAQPAEIFIADGRIQANPPAGISELSRSLPKFNFSF